MLEIKNPEKQNIVLSLMAAVLGIIVIAVPFIFASMAVYNFYFIYCGAIVVIIALGYGYSFYRRYREFNAFLEKQDQALVWEYDEAQYTSFIGEMNSIQKTSDKKQVWILLGIELIIAILLALTFDGVMKLWGVAFFVVFGAGSLLFTLVLPHSYETRALVKPYVTIINEDSAYIMGHFHKWMKAEAKIKKTENGEKVYKVLAINYEKFTRNGRMYEEWSALIPDSNDTEILAEAKRQAGRINKLSRQREKEGAEINTFQKWFGKNKTKEAKSTETKALK